MISTACMRYGNVTVHVQDGPFACITCWGSPVNLLTGIRVVEQALYSFTNQFYHSFGNTPCCSIAQGEFVTDK